MNLKDIITKVRDSITDNKTWQAEKDSVLSQLQEAEAKINDYMESAVTAEQMKASYETKINELNEANNKTVQSLNDTIKDLQGKIEAEKNSAEIKAQALASSMGITSEDKLPKVTNTVSVTEQLEKATSQKEMWEIFNKHKTEILKTAGVTPEKWDARIK